VFVKTTLRILNVEDDAMDADLNLNMLRARWPEAKLSRVDTLNGFVNEVKRGGYDLILSDYTMPDFDGRKALEIAREFCPDVPFLFVSGTIGEDWAIEALKSGATDYVLKHRLMRLIPAVDRALREVSERAERERVEQAMWESERKYRELFECLGQAAFLVDEATGKILDSNRSAGEMLGRSRSQIVGHNLSEFFTKPLTRLESGNQPRPSQAVEVGEIDKANGERTRVQVHTSRLTLYGRPLLIRLCHEFMVDNPV
jgi:PAS domain S-box-containing protein